MPRDDVTRPITLYVEKVEQEPPDIADLIESRRVSVVDIELTCQQARELVVALRKRDCRETIGSIRIRFKGRLVLP